LRDYGALRPKLSQSGYFLKFFQESFVIFFSNFSDFDFPLDLSFEPLIQAQHVVLVSGAQQYFKRWGFSILSLTKNKFLSLIPLLKER